MPSRLCLLALVAALTCAARPATADTVAAAEALGKLQRTAQSLDRLWFAVSELERLPYELSATIDAVANDPILGPLAANLIALYQQRTWRATAYANLTGESSGAAGAAVGAEVTWDSALCRLLGAGIDGQLFRDGDGAGAAYSTYVGGCIPLPGDTIELTVRRKHDVRPSLLALPLTRTGRYDADGFDLGLRFWRFQTSHNQIDIMPLGFAIELTHEDLSGTRLRGGEYDLGTSPVAWQRRGRGFLGGDQTWQFMAIRLRGRAEAMDQEGLYFDDNVGTISPLRITSLGVGGGMFLDASVAWSRGELLAADGTVADDFVTPEAEVSLSSGGPLIHADVGFRHGLEPIVAGQILAEDRLSTSLTWSFRRSLTTVDGFVASNRVHAIGVVSDRVTSAGVGARYGIDLGAGVEMWLRAELARSLVPDAGGVVLDPTVGVRALLAIAGQTSWQQSTHLQ